MTLSGNRIAAFMLTIYSLALAAFAVASLGQIFAISARLAFSLRPAKSRNARIFNGTSDGRV